MRTHVRYHSQRYIIFLDYVCIHNIFYHILHKNKQILGKFFILLQ